MITQHNKSKSQKYQYEWTSKDGCVIKFMFSEKGGFEDDEYPVEMWRCSEVDESARDCAPDQTEYLMAVAGRGVFKPGDKCYFEGQKSFRYLELTPEERKAMFGKVLYGYCKSDIGKFGNTSLKNRNGKLKWEDVVDWFPLPEQGELSQEELDRGLSVSWVVVVKKGDHYVDRTYKQD